MDYTPAGCLPDIQESLHVPVLVNLQGDEPELSGASIDLAIRLLEEDPEAVMSTLATPIRSRSQLEDSLRRLAESLFNGKSNLKLDYANIPSVVFAHPPVASVGLTEPQACERHGDSVTVYESDFTPMRHALSTHGSETAMKLVCVGAQEKVVGCHIIGPGADEMLQGFAVAIRMGAHKKDLDDTIAIHPTSAEELVTMR